MNINNLKSLRKENKKTQTDIANFLNITTVGYNGYETQKREPSIDTLIKLADYYGVSLDYLVGRDFGNGLGYLNENQITFIKTFLALNTANQMSAIIYVANLLANQ